MSSTLLYRCGRCSPALLAAFQDDRPAVAVEAGRSVWRLGPKADPVLPALLSLAQGPIGNRRGRGICWLRLAPVSSPCCSSPNKTTRQCVRLLPMYWDASGRRRGRLSRTSSPLSRINRPLWCSWRQWLWLRLIRLCGGPSVRLLTDALDLPVASLALANLGPSARSAVADLIAALRPRKESVNQELIRLNAQLALGESASRPCRSD